MDFRISLFPKLIFLSLLLVNAAAYKILVYSPAFGFSHMNFMGQIADTLVDAGHQVTVFQPILIENLPGTGTKKANFMSVGPDPRTKKLMEKVLTVEEIKGIWSYSAHSVTAVLWSTGFIGQASQYTCEMMLDDHDLLTDLRGEKFDMAIIELFDFSGLALFHAIGVTNIIGAHTTGIFEFTSLHIGNPVIPSYIPGAQSYTNSDSSIYNRATNIMMTYVSWLFPRRISSGTQRCMDVKWGKAAPNLDNIVANITWVYTNSEPFFDFSKPVLPTIIELGGIGVQKPKPLDEKWDKLLSKRKTNILVSFGSVAQAFMMPEQYKQSIAKMFAAFPDITFIWKYEKPEENEFVKHLDNVHLSNWLPQNDILGDPRISLFLTHGGAGSVFESAMNGVPVLAIAMFGDQMRNSKMVERHGFGLEYYKLDIPKTDKLIEAIKRVLDDESYKKNAKKVAELFTSRPFSPQEKLVKTIEIAGKFGADERFRNPGRNLTLVQYYNLDILLIIVILAIVILFIALLLVRSFIRRLFDTSKSKKE